MAKILVGLSGGVDSSLAAALLLEQGHDVVGGYMKNWINTEDIPGDCPWEQDLDDAYAVAKHLGIEFRVVDLIDHYKERIVDYLLSGYQEGITPNPDVFCNREMKFGVFLDYALEQGFESVGTGHYARRRGGEDGQPAQLWRGSDPNKDQSYFLSMMKQDQVNRARFPVGEMLKTEVRKQSEAFGLPTAQKKDSQGICFIGNVKMTDFLTHYVPDKPGEIVTTEGKVMGQHRGLHLYTLGQRKGHGVASPKTGVAYVVVRKDYVSNQLVVGYDQPDTQGLYATVCEIGSLSSLGADFTQPFSCQIQPRYRSQAEAALVEPIGDGRVRITFQQAQRALTPGQICAFYDNARLIGAGVFEVIV